MMRTPPQSCRVSCTSTVSHSKTKAASAKSNSSPRTWGTPPRKPACYAIYRFIPTLVGNTSEAHRDTDRLAVHPHARGEHDNTQVLAMFKPGSSPRSWGTLHRQAGNVDRARFIPTLVGNTAANAAVMTLRAVHPHARGEHPG